MVSRKTGTVTYKRALSSRLAIFRLIPPADSTFLTYKAGQYIALGRDDARLTKKTGLDCEGRPLFAPDLDKAGHQRTGRVIHSYTIASAPWETATYGFLEFYVVQETLPGGVPGRLSTVLLSMPSGGNEHVDYVDRIVGNFTLDKLVQGAKRIIMIGTGTGLAPFVSMIKQLHHGSSQPGFRDRTYTLLHTNRTFAELGHHPTLLEIEASGSFDFMYLPTVSRPTRRDYEDRRLGVGRATNLLRLLYGLPMKEEEDVDAATAGGSSVAEAEGALAQTPRPALPAGVDLARARSRLDPASAVVLTCGNPASMADVQRTAARVGIRCEVEEW